MKLLLFLLTVLFLSSCQECKYKDEVYKPKTRFDQLDSDKKIFFDEDEIGYDNNNPTAIFASKKAYHNPDEEAYIQRFVKTARAEQRKFGIPASITLAQGILESGMGGSSLASKHNNHFGVKAGRSWKGKTVKLKTKEWDKKKKKYKVIIGKFKTYKTAWESFRDHSHVLMNPWYKRCHECGNDWRCWAIQLKACGYATDPNYPYALKSIIKRNKLYKYDKF